MELFLPIILAITSTVTTMPLPTPTPELLTAGKGIAAAYANAADINKLNVEAFYYWSPTAASWLGQTEARWYPMIRDRDDAEDILAGNRPYDFSGGVVMLFNECDAPHGSGQCEMSAQEAAEFTQALQAKFTGLKWVAPAVHNWGLSGWLSNYMNACHGCAFDALNIHWYEWGRQFNRTCSVDDFAAYVDEFRQYGLPIWVTEVACLDHNQPDTWAYRVQHMRDYHQFAQGDPLITGFFPWSLKIGPLYGWQVQMDYVDIDTGELTPLGEWYEKEEIK